MVNSVTKTMRSDIASAARLIEILIIRTTKLTQRNKSFELDAYYALMTKPEVNRYLTRRTAQLSRTRAKRFG